MVKILKNSGFGSYSRGLFFKMRTLLFICMLANGYGMDTLTVMTYNVLRFDGSETNRAANIKKTIDYINPDLVVFQEIENQSGIELLLNNVFNTDSAAFAAGPIATNQNMKSGMVYRTSAFDLSSSVSLTTALRDIPGYTLSIRNAHNNVSPFTIFSAHLKASQGEEYRRWEEAKELYHYVSNQDSNFHYIMAGDFNLYDPSEPAYKLLTDSMKIDLEDPIGDWNRNDGSHVEKFTQSTRDSQLNDGGAPGGLDDRFDFILFSDHFTKKNPDLKYVEGSYVVVGNDGNHFNKSITDGPNSSVPDSIAKAIYNASDHYPVVAKIIYTSKSSTSPIAYAGGDMMVAIGDTVFLDGSQSYDPNGMINAFNWIQTSGPNITISMASSVKASFVVPTVNRTTTFTFKLTVTDNDGEAATDFVNVIVPVTKGYTPYDIQFTENEGSGEDCFPSDFEGQNVEVTGVVTAVRPDQTYPNFYFQDPTKNDWAGMFVYVPDGYKSPSVGDEIKLKGDVAEYFGMTEMKNIDSTSILSSNHVINPLPVAAASVSGSCRVWVEKYEGMLVQLTNITVSQSANENGQWYVSDWSGQAMIDDYFFEGEWLRPAFGTHFVSISGVLHFSYGEYKLMPRDINDFNAPITAVGDELPNNYELITNYPNPFNPYTTIEFNTGSDAVVSVKLDILDINGRLVTTLVDGIPISNKFIWNARNKSGKVMPAGIYFARLTFNSKILTKKMVLLK